VEKWKKEKLCEDLALPARTMVRFSCKINFFIGHNCSLGQGKEVDKKTENWFGF
jgi:hypothetical protein